ncbi:MAG: glycoside hydrolase family 3 C-terminal domain-containing protein [Lachnospiraceae bacterium]|nr:glycoside hydrolase family 3 C-terminal domain-containing protein [Lachnospiraceae bacterium]
MSEIFASRSPEIEEREIRHMELTRRLAGECMVLLKNDGVLPLKTAGRIAAFGNGVRHTVKGGTGSGDVNTRSNVNIEQGLINAGFEITTAEWLDRQDTNLKKSKEDYEVWANKEAEKRGVPPIVMLLDEPYREPAPVMITRDDIILSDTDTAVYVITRNSGEGADRFDRPGDYTLFPEEKQSLELIAQNYKNTIVVLNIGGVMDLSELDAIDGVDAILLMNQLGNIGGDALLDVLTGKANPSGKTTDTWAKNYMDYPSSAKFSHNESVHDEMYEDGIYVGYRYFDSFGIEPEYPFGYGLSYTDFELSEQCAVADGDKVKVSVKVRNTGSEYAGKEVVQVYYSAPDGKLDKPYQELAAYKKTELLEPGQEQTVTIEFDIADMASYSEKLAAWVLEKGEYVIRVGNSSANTMAAGILVLDETIKNAQGENLFALDVKLDEIKPDEAFVLSKKNAAECEAVKRSIVDKTAINTRMMTYQGSRTEYTTDKTKMLTMQDVIEGKCTVEELVSQLTVDEMAQFCVGTLRADMGSLVGNASYTIPGAAGDTSSVCKDSRGIKNLILADGPAGLRLQPHFKVNKKDGSLVAGGDTMGDFVNPFDPSVKEEDTEDYYQYCTAIPIGWALAQSWNTELAERIGDMIGSEMEQFGVDLWLAPALNIHRNPLCGRNFEYYSEDPVISGCVAAAVTRGVQSHKGKGTTIKHFAVNNQEDNRYFVNAHVSERALREIYLKGFEIAVKTSQPLSIMTSYNLLNGIHTANSHDLIQGMARDEWGFEGFVMTDWFTSQDLPALTGKFGHIYPISASTGCIYAGNDVQMPGCRKNVDDIVEAVNTGKELDGYRITKADLQFNTANLIRVIVKTM